jgi:SnoaL-like domain
MAYTLQQLSDLEDIRTVKHRYFRSIDTADMAMLDTLFTDDVFVEYIGGGYRVQLEGKANMLEFIANSFPETALAMHHGHMPDISFTGPDTAEGIWYLEDVFIDLELGKHTAGSALYRDHYVRQESGWKIARTIYERVIEIVYPISKDGEITAHYLAKHGRKLADRTDISHLLKWGNPQDS